MDVIEQRMASGEPFTLGDLERVCWVHEGNFRDPAKVIQEWQKRGWISYRLYARRTIWSLTAAGKAAIQSNGQEE